MKNKAVVDHLILTCAKKGLILFWLLFEPKAVRISPPLTISIEEIEKGCILINSVLNGFEDREL
jgi:4-aminobutyrate aminotransferase-like enzyme